MRLLYKIFIHFHVFRKSFSCFFCFLACCSTYMVKGLEVNYEQDIRMGIYQMIPDLLWRHMPVWRNERENYLFFISGQWIMGPDYKSATAGIKTENSMPFAGCPDNFTDWLYWAGEGWSSTGELLSITCKALHFLRNQIFFSFVHCTSFRN